MVNEELIAKLWYEAEYAEPTRIAILLDDAAAALAAATAPPEHPPCGCVPLPPLTRRQREVFDLMGEGCTHAEIAVRLWISEKAVESIVGRIGDRLGLHGRGLHRRAIAEAVLREHGVPGHG